MTRTMTTCLVLSVFLMPTFTTTLEAAKENGAKKCSDGIDNDGDGLIDGDDPDCGGGGGQPPEAYVDAGWVSASPQPIQQTSLVNFVRIEFNSSGSDVAKYQSTEPAVVSFNLTAADLDHTHWDASYCSMLEGVDLPIETGKFRTKWFLQGSDNCFDDPCVATVTMTHSYNLADLDRVVIVARTEDYVANDVGADGDMFQGVVGEEIYLATVKASFYVPGQNRADGSCVWETSIPSLWTVLPAPAP